MSATAEKMALALAERYADYMETSPGTTQQALGHVFEGVCIGVHAAGYCMTSAGVLAVTVEAYNKVGPRSDSRDRLVWAASMVEAIVTHNWFC